MKTPAFLLALVGLLAAGCATTARYDAAGDVHDLLVAVRDNDRKAFERHIDRDALRRQIEARMVREARASDASQAFKSFGIALSQPGAAIAEAVLLQPGFLKMAAEHYGYTPDQPVPGRMAIAGSLKHLDDGRVCVTRKKDGPCLLYFTERGGTWRLTGFDGELSDLRATLAAAK